MAGWRAGVGRILRGLPRRGGVARRLQLPAGGPGQAGEGMVGRLRRRRAGDPVQLVLGVHRAAEARRQEARGLLGQAEREARGVGLDGREGARAEAQRAGHDRLRDTRLTSQFTKGCQRCSVFHFAASVLLAFRRERVRLRSRRQARQ